MTNIIGSFMNAVLIWVVAMGTTAIFWIVLAIISKGGDE